MVAPHAFSQLFSRSKTRELINDYMIIVLEQEVTNEHIELASLAVPPYKFERDQDLTVIGFGRTSEKGPLAKILQKVQVKFFDYETYVPTRTRGCPAHPRQLSIGFPT